MDGGRGGVDVFFLLFHVSDDLSEVFSVEVGAPWDFGDAGNAAHDVAGRCG